KVRVTRVEEGRNWVETIVVDDETGRPVPCRVHFRSARGVPYQPHGHHRHVYSNLGTWHVDVGGDLRLGQTTYAYADGPPPGRLPLRRGPHRRRAAARRGAGRRGARLRVRAAPPSGHDRARPAPPRAAAEALDEHEREALVQRRHARPLPFDAGQPARGAGRG